jgi:hypothetical protein
MSILIALPVALQSNVKRAITVLLNALLVAIMSVKLPIVAFTRPISYTSNTEIIFHIIVSNPIDYSLILNTQYQTDL